MTKTLSRLQSWLAPSYILPLLLLALPFERIPSVTVSGVTIRISMLVGLVLIGLWAWQHRQNFLKDAPTGMRLLIVFVVIAAISATYSVAPKHSLRTVGFDLFVMLLAVAVAWAVQTVKPERLYRFLLGGAIIACLVGLYQFFGDLLGLPVAITGLREEYTRVVFGFPRIQGTSLEPLYFASFLLLPAAIEASLTLQSKRKGWILALLFTCVFLTVSRGGIIASFILIAILVAYGLSKRHYARSLRTAAMLGLGLAMSYFAISVLVPASAKLNIKPPVNTHTNAVTQDQLSDKLEQASDTFQKQAINTTEGVDLNGDRGRTRTIAIDLIKSHPWFGVGPGQFGYYARQSYPAYTDNQTVNNITLELLAETGVLGTLAIVLFALVVFAHALKAFWHTTDPESKAWILALLAYLVATVIQYQTFSPLYIIHIWTALGLLMGLSKLSLKKT